MATQAVLLERVGVAEDLLQRAQRLIGAEGQVKLCGKLRSELKFLRRIQSGGTHVRGAHVHSSNLTHLSAVVQSAETLQTVVALLQVFTFTDSEGNKHNLTVDVVADGGLLWVKAVGRKAEALHAVWQGRGQFGDRSVIGQAREFLLAASQHPLHYTLPRVVFAFYNGVSSPMAQELERLGVGVRGDVVGVSEVESEEEEEEAKEEERGVEDREQSNVGNGVHHRHPHSEPAQDQAEALPALTSLSLEPQDSLDQDLVRFYQDSDSDSDPWPLTRLDRSLVLSRVSFPFPAPALAPDCHRVNLDVSTLLALVSSLTHGGCHLTFREAVLTEQAANERQVPVLPVLEAFMAGKELLASTAAVTDFKEILRTLGGAKEKERAQSLLGRVTVVTDRPSTRTLALVPSATVTPRSVAIFGTGDALHAITMTANRRFVRAAANQGVHFSVFIHEPRALTEGKEWRASPVKNYSPPESRPKSPLDLTRVHTESPQTTQDHPRPPESTPSPGVNRGKNGD